MPSHLTAALEQWKQNLQAVLVAWGDEPPDERLAEVLQAVGAGNYPHAHGRSLLAHLSGTRDILRAWSQPFRIQAAGLFHSIYSSDVYRPKVLDLTQRRWLQALIGKEAERLVYLFHSVPRYQFFERVFDPLAPLVQGLAVATGKDGEKPGVLSAAEVSGLLVIHMANEAEQSCLANGMPGVWLARVSALGNRVRAAQGSAPPIFDDCQTLFSSADELLLRESYSQGIDGVAEDRAAAAANFAACAKLCPWVAEPSIFAAYLRILEGDVASAQQQSQHAIEILNQWSCAWDKRLSWQEWQRLARTLMDADEAPRLSSISPELVKEPRAFFQRVISVPRSAVFSVPQPVAASLPPGSGSATAAPPASSGVARLDRYLSSFADSGSDPRKRIYPELPSQPWHDPGDFPIVRALEGAYDEIKDEIFRLTDESFHHESERIARKGAWEVFFFYERGRKNVENCARCPSITAIIEQHETVRTHAGLIYVSRMRAGTHIAPHRGPTNLRLRCHLGICIPDGDCGLRVGREMGNWTEGRCLVFDDYYEHEAWNYTDADRVVLIVDLWHSALTPHEREALKSLHRYAFVHAEDLNRYWHGNLKAKTQATAEYH